MKPHVTGPTRVFAADLGALDARQLADCAALLDAREQERAARFVFERDRRRFIAAHGFLRRVLALELDCSAAKIEFELGPFGKPNLLNSPLHFSLTHTGEHALLAVGAGELGLDAEERIASRVDAPLAQRVMTAEEYAFWSRAPVEQKVSGFFRLWSAKESVMKATGLGLGLGTKSFAVFAGESLSLLEKVPAAGRCWRLQELESPPAYALVLASEFETATLRVDWP